MMKPVCVVAGVGPGNGAALARRFASEGSAVALLARTTELTGKIASGLPDARAHLVTSPTQAPSRARSVRFAATSATSRSSSTTPAPGLGQHRGSDRGGLRGGWRVNALGGFLASKQVIPAMKRAGRRSIVFVGATASRKAGARSASFSPAKGAQRSLAESLARALWPAGTHVAVIVGRRRRPADSPGLEVVSQAPLRSLLLLPFVHW